MARLRSRLLASNGRGVRTVLFALCLLPVLYAFSAGERKSIGSSSGRFYVSGENSAILLSTARWADSVADKIEKLLKIKSRATAQKSFYLLVRPGTAGRVTTKQGVSDGRLVQQLLIERFDDIDWELALETFCELYADGLIGDHFRGTGKTPIVVDVPDWLSVGLAQHMDPGLRARNTQSIILRHKAGLMPDAATVRSWTVMAAPNEEQRAVSGLFVSFLLYYGDRGELMTELLRETAAGKSIESEWLVERIPDCNTTEALEEKWQEWIDRESRTILGPGVITDEWVRKLKAVLSAEPGLLSVPADDESLAAIGFRDLIERKDEKWVATFCAKKMAEIRMIIMGRPQNFVDVGEGYSSFLDGLARKKWNSTLRKRLRKADELMAELEVLLVARREYVDAVEAGMAGDNESVDVDALDDDVLERSEMQRYIDRIEQKMVPSSASASDGTDN